MSGARGAGGGARDPAGSARPGWRRRPLGEPHSLSRVVVVGGGIAGLAAAQRLRRLLPAAELTVVDGATRLGGKLRTGELAGLPVEEGAETFLVRAPEAAQLAAQVGLGEQLTHPVTGAASVYARGALRPLPARTLLGVPADLGTLADSGVLSPGGLARVPLDLLLPRTPVEGDVPVGAHVARRLGREVVDRLVDPLLGGVYAGRADELSLAATAPALFAAACGRRSLLLGARAAVPAPTGAPVFATVRGGLGRLVAATAAAAGVRVVLGRPVRELRRTPDGWQVVHGSTRDATVEDADAVVLAVPAAPAARLLRAAVPAAAVELAAIEYAQVALVALAFPSSALPALSGSGVLVPAVEGLAVKAVTHLSAKWGQRGDVAVLRCSFGRYGDNAVLQRDDADLVALARRDLATVSGIDADLAPVAARVSRWGGALPQYAVGHLDRVARIRSAVAAVPGLAVCGAAYDGVGIPAVVRSAWAAAERVAAPETRPG